MCAGEEQYDGHGEQELLRGSVLVPVVDLLPHVEVVKGARVEVEGHTAHVVEHEVGSRHVREVDQGPRCLLRHAWDDIEEDLAEEYEHGVDGPGAWVVSSSEATVRDRPEVSKLTLCVDPFCVQVRQGGLVAELLQRLRGLLVDKTTATSPPGLLGLERHGRGAGWGGVRRAGPRVASEVQAGGAVEEYGRQLGGWLGVGAVQPREWCGVRCPRRSLLDARSVSVGVGLGAASGVAGLSGSSCVRNTSGPSELQRLSEGKGEE
jgi:hypothetical protein